MESVRLYNTGACQDKINRPGDETSHFKDGHIPKIDHQQDDSMQTSLTRGDLRCRQVADCEVDVCC